MKTLIASAVLLAFIFATDVNASPLIGSKKECKSNKCQTFGIGMYRVKNTLSMNLLMEKLPGQRLDIVLTDSNGKVLYQEGIGKRLEKYCRRFNFEQMGDGDYTIEISGLEEKITRKIAVRTNKVFEVHDLEIAGLN